MEQIISEKELKELKELKVEVRGMGAKNFAGFILEKEGEKGLERLENTMAEIGFPIKYSEMKAMKFYPFGLETATLIVIKKLFNYDDKKFQEMGKFGVKFSMLIRLFMKYFISLEKLAKQAPQMWKKGGNLGDFKIQEYDLEKRYIVLRIENFKGHPIYCQIFKGYFQGAIQMIVGKEATSQETKCMHKGDDYHEFLLKW